MNLIVDSLQLLSGEKIRITDKIIYGQPKLRTVAEFGEERYWNVLATLTRIPSDMKSVLWDIGIDWMEISDMELFCTLVRELSQDLTEVFFPGICFTDAKLVQNDSGDKFIYCGQSDTKIDFLAYMRMQECLCKSHGIKKKVERAGNKYTKQILIDEDRQKRQLNANKEFESSLIGPVSALVNYSGFKYNYENVWGLTMYQFMDALQRCRMFESINHLLNGIYAGTVDSKKIKNEKLDWTREVREK